MQPQITPCIRYHWTCHLGPKGGLFPVQLHASSTSSTCGEDKRLRLSSVEMAQVFITSTAELPGLVVAALLADVLGRKRCLPLLFPPWSPAFPSTSCVCSPVQVQVHAYAHIPCVSVRL